MKENRNRSNLCLYIAVGSFVVFLLALVGLKTGIVTGFDSFIGYIFKRTDWSTAVMKAITFLGEAESLIFIGVIFTLFCKRKKDGAKVLLNLGIIAGLNSFVKNLVKRPRPDILNRLVSVGGFSFPSGHSASSIAFYGFLIYLVYNKCQNIFLRNILIIFLSLLIVTIGMSRIYLGVHYPSDVVGGFAFGLSWVAIFVYFLRKFED